MRPHTLITSAVFLAACQASPTAGELTGFERLRIPTRYEQLRAPHEASESLITPLPPKEAWLHEDARRVAYLGPLQPGCGLEFGGRCWTPRAKIELELGVMIGDRAPGTLSPDDPGSVRPEYATTLAIDRARRPKPGRYNLLVRFPRMSRDWRRFEVSLDLAGNHAYWLFRLDAQLEVSMAVTTAQDSLRHTKLEMWVLEDRRRDATPRRAMQWSSYFDEVDVILEHPDSGEVFSHARVRSGDPTLVRLPTLPGHHFVRRRARVGVLPYYRRM